MQPDGCVIGLVAKAFGGVIPHIGASIGEGVGAALTVTVGVAGFGRLMRDSPLLLAKMIVAKRSPLGCGKRSVTSASRFSCTP